MRGLLPYGIRVVARKIYETAQDRLQRANPTPTPSSSPTPSPTPSPSPSPSPTPNADQVPEAAYAMLACA